MSDRFFPDLPEDAWWALEIVFQNIEEDPTYLQDDGCPYPSWLREFFETPERVFGMDGDEDDGEDLDLSYESARLFRELKQAKDGFSSDDHAEKMAYFRTSTSLLEKLVGMRERANNVKQISRFYQTVLDIMDEVLDEDKREAVRERLKEKINGGS